MVLHDHRCDSKPSGAGGFTCHVCGVQKRVGEMVVAFKNDNKAAAWDHVCEGECADKYQPPALKGGIGSGARAAIGSALRAALKKLKESVGAAPEQSADVDFLEKAKCLEFSHTRDDQGVLRGDVAAAAYVCRSSRR